MGGTGKKAVIFQTGRMKGGRWLDQKSCAGKDLIHMGVHH